MDLMGHHLKTLSETIFSGLFRNATCNSQLVNEKKKIIEKNLDCEDKWIYIHCVQWIYSLHGMFSNNANGLCSVRL